MLLDARWKDGDRLLYLDGADVLVFRDPADLFAEMDAHPEAVTAARPYCNSAITDKSDHAVIRAVAGEGSDQPEPHINNGVVLCRVCPEMRLAASYWRAMLGYVPLLGAYQTAAGRDPRHTSNVLGDQRVFNLAIRELRRAGRHIDLPAAWNYRSGADLLKCVVSGDRLLDPEGAPIWIAHATGSTPFRPEVIALATTPRPPRWTAPKIDVRIAFEPGGGLGRDYNRIFQETAADWVLLLDHDVLLLHPNWYAVCQRAISDRPDAGLITAVCNDIASPFQLSTGAPGHDAPVDAHRRYARELWDRYGHETAPVPRGRSVGGFLMLVRKQAWSDVGGFGEDSFFALDTTFARAMGKTAWNIYTMRGLYCYHRRERTDKTWIAGDAVSADYLLTGKRKVVYTVAMGNIPPPRLTPWPGWDCEILTSGAPGGFSPKRAASWAKIHAHKLFPNHDVSLYVDADFILANEPTGIMWRPLVMGAHPQRTGVSEELRAMVTFGKTTAEKSAEAAAVYASMKVPDGLLCECGFILRHHHNPAVVRLCDEWWRIYSVDPTERDQVAFAAAQHISGVRPHMLTTRERHTIAEHHHQKRAPVIVNHPKANRVGKRARA
jgi:GT2 family glycosyltransferase